MNGHGMEGNGSIDAESIRAVVEACQCDEAEAVDLLMVRDTPKAAEKLRS